MKKSLSAHLPDRCYIATALLCFCTFISGIVYAQDSILLIRKGANLTKISDQFKFTEGPAADRKGNVYFTDQPNNTIWRYDTKGKLTLFMSGAGRSNGLFIDKKGNLISCADENNELWQISTSKATKVLASGYGNKRLNGPNDLWIHPNGNIYFTDPFYKRDYWKRSEQEQRGMYVFVYNFKTKTIAPVDTTLQRPNGIVGSRDGKQLFVADIAGNKTYRYDVSPDGSLTNKQLFVNQGSDGMTIDRAGNIYLTGKGITVYNAAGNKITNIPVPANWTANVCFSGKNNDVLFITASESIFTLQMKVKGN